MRVNRAIFPSIFTILNIFCGFLSVISAINGKYIAASWYIIIAAIFDTLDGKIARLMKGYSRFGVEFDSIADVISFCLAPSILIYQIYVSQLPHDLIFNGFPVAWDQMGLLLSFTPLLFGGIRLARFNVSASFDKDIFTGLPTPASAITICSFVLFNLKIFDNDLQYGFYLIPLALFVSLLNVSKLKYDTFPKFSRKQGAWNQIKLVAFLVLLIVFVFFPDESLFPISLLFTLTGFIRGVILGVSKPVVSDEDQESKVMNAGYPK